MKIADDGRLSPADNLHVGDRVLVTLDIEAGAVRELVSLTQFAVSTDTTRAYLNSALFEWGKGQALMVSTNGRQLAKLSVTVASESASAGPSLIPLKAITELRRIAE